MIGCSAPFCNNSTAKGYIVKIFPKNPERRAQWVANMNVENWIPNNRSYLCEVHFSPEMWEQRRDKKPKLKLNAVPTIFGYWLKEKTFKRTEDKVINFVIYTVKIIIVAHFLILCITTGAFNTFSTK
ncbi:THAP domain-containing protein [Ooceraea biroi]|uniref:THAP domain-containing protein n=1 Tax=Ooceraea biroi TaxID=2015173 RepID=A0A026VYK3_OOCBI|nr:THAP domain-containing protein [Ooceraea biroi]